MLCILYVTLLATCLGMAALAVERAAPAAWPRRWIWCAAIVLSMTIPPIYQASHTATISTSAASAHGSWVGMLESQNPVAMRIWVIVSLLLLLASCFEFWRVSRIVRRTLSGSHARVTVDGVSVLMTESCGPATVGALKSNVLIPRWVMALPTSLRRYVLCHEEEHRRARDVLLLFIASIPLIMTPWNLALWWHFRRLSLAVELDCDNRVVAALGNPKVYGELLYKVAQASSAGPRLQPGFLGGRGMLERRLSRLLEPVQISRLERVLLPTIAIALLVVALLSPHPVSDTRVAAKHASANHTVRP